jgi:class 3 adenylate cyclase
MFRPSLRAKITLAMALVALTVAAATVATNYRTRSRQLLAEFQTLVRSAAGTAALALSGREDLGSIRVAADADTPAFQNTRAVLEAIRRINRLNENEIYLLRPLADAATTHETEFIVMLQPKPFIGARYTVPAANWSLVFNAWSTGEPESSAIYKDEHGRWISGYAPVRDRAGNPAAIVEVDAEISRFLSRQREELMFSLLVAVAAFALAMLPGLLLASRLTRGLNRLAAGMRRFQAGDARVRLQLRTGDEVQRLGEVFNEMILSLAEKLALLPFVSRFTAEAVHRSREDPSLLTGMEQNVVVLFSDLRGFTRFSEELEAAALVRELNALLAAQAEAVLSAGGDVDKFVGDAVMALFLDEAADGGVPGKALACAEEMMRRVAAKTAVDGGSALALGVGIHRGRAVVGAVGSDVRRDFTAIGHTVNLASRLCGKAAGWEILVSGDFYAALPAPACARFTRTPPLELKNVQKFLPTYALDCRPEKAATGNSSAKVQRRGELPGNAEAVPGNRGG